jgi:hypothetical protein
MRFLPRCCNTSPRILSSIGGDEVDGRSNKRTERRRLALSSQLGLSSDTTNGDIDDMSNTKEFRESQEPRGGRG